MFRFPANVRAAALTRAFTPATFVRRTQGYQGTIQRSYSSAHEEETYEAFNDRYAQFFENVDDSFELQR
ncbi:Cytochrome c oxidase subunit 6, partial [Dispira simplex]